jgi:hypothetical protein
MLYRENPFSTDNLFYQDTKQVHFNEKIEAFQMRNAR